MHFLAHALRAAAHPAAQEGALAALYKLAEDAPLQLTMDLPIGAPAAAGGAPTLGKPINLAMELTAPLFAAADADVRYQAVRTFNLLVPFMPEWLVANIDGYALGLLALAATTPEARILQARAASASSA